MSRRSPRQTAAFSLFTFLDVMLCTLGALIIVLICVVRTAQIKNADEAPETLAELEELEGQTEMIQWRTKHLANSIDASRAQLRDRRLELAHIEEHSRRLGNQLAELETAEAALANQSINSPQLDRLRADAQQFARLIAEAEREVGQARTAAGSRRPSYAVVPYQGPNQTTRRPMYIECTAGRIVLQPENIELTDQDFVSFGPGNPLAAGLRAGREYLARAQYADDGSEAYPLMLVRPDGVDAFYAAKEAMSSWGAEFGYELVDQDWKLEFRQPEPAMVDCMRLAVEEARIRQRALARAAPRVFAEHEREWYRVSSRGGIVKDSGPADDGDSLGAGYGKQGRSGARGGSGYRGGAERSGWSAGGRPGLGGPGRTGVARGGGRPGYAGGGNSSRPSAATTDDNPYLAVASAPSTGAGVGGVAGTSGGVGSANAVGPRGGESASNVAEPSAEGASGEAGSAGIPQTTGPYFATGGNGWQTGGSGGPNAGAAAESAGAANGNRYNGRGPGTVVGAEPQIGGAAGTGRYGTNPGAGGGTGATGENGTGAPEAQQFTANGARGGAGAASGRYAAKGTGSAGGGQVDGKGDSSSGDQADGQSGGGAGGASQATGKPAGRLAQSLAKGQSKSGQASGGTPGGPSLSVGGSADSGAASGASRATVQMGNPGAMTGSTPSASVSLAESRGKNWGLPEEARRAVPITRPIRIECRPDKLVLRSEETPGQRQEIPLRGRTEESVEDLVAGVWQRVDTWGSAGRGMYWHPLLSVDVAPGADGRFADLQILLADSGLEVKQAAKAPAQATQPKRKAGLW